ncbi:MAG: rhodanese-like domain-containing protein [Vicinamibacteraceae bacterium]
MKRLRANLTVLMAHARRQLDLLLGPTVSSISPPEAKELLDTGGAITFADVRTLRAWDEAETILPGAIRLPLHELDDHAKKLQRDTLVVTYCT